MEKITYVLYVQSHLDIWAGVSKTVCVMVTNDVCSLVVKTRIEKQTL